MITRVRPAVNEARADGRWQARSIAAGVLGSFVASFCCLPAAVAAALGLGLGTVVTLSQLLAYQRFFQVGGLAFAGAVVWLILRRSRATCSLAEHERDRNRVPLYVFGAFAAAFAFLNVVVIPLLERLS